MMEMEQKEIEEINPEDSASKSYQQLNDFLLKFLLGEVVYLIVFVASGFGLGLLPLASDLFPIELLFIGIIIIGLIAFGLNVILCIPSLYLHIITKHEGYPGTGHLLNWIFVMANAWIIILFTVLVGPTWA